MLATWGCTTFPKPTLSLDFLGATSLDSGITFSRGSQATLFDSTGTLRYAKHNLAVQSQTFQTTWIVSNSSVSTDATVAPDGTTTADKLIENTANAVHQIEQTVTVLSSGTYAASFYIKADTRTKARVAFITGGTGGVFADADLIAGTIGAATAFGGGVAISSAIHNMGNGWFRCIVTGIGPASTSGQLRVELLDAAGNRTYTGDGTSGLFLWGAQLNIANMEGGVTSSLTTYYPTTTAAYYAPRFDYDPSTLQPRGLLIEEQRTNSIRNNTMQGAVAGTPGTLPTNWSTGLAGLTQEIVGTGTQNGINYIDIRLSGTSTGTQAVIRWEGASDIAVLNGQSWTHSVWLSLRSGALPSGAVNISSNLFTSGGAYIADFGSLNVKSSISASLTRVTSAATINSATAAFARPYIFFLMASGETVDFTIRIGLPQMEQGAFATSVIPTTTTALTRNADVASMTGTNFSSWFNASQGTVVFFGTRSSAGQPNMWMFSNGATATERYYLRYVSGQFQFIPRAGGVDGPGVFVSAAGSLTTARHATAYTSNQDRIASNGTQDGNSTQTITSQPTNLNTLYIGSFTGTGSFLNGTVQKIAFYPTALSNAQLQALTA